MCSLFFAYDHQNYARYTTIYLLFLLNLPHTHPGAAQLLKQNGFSVSRSDVPSSRNAVDITIEETINRHAKSQGGIVGFSRSLSQGWIKCGNREHCSQEMTRKIEEIITLGRRKREEGGRRKREEGGRRKREEGGRRKREEGGRRKREEGGGRKKRGRKEKEEKRKKKR